MQLTVRVIASGEESRMASNLYDAIVALGAAGGYLFVSNWEREMPPSITADAMVLVGPEHAPSQFAGLSWFDVVSRCLAQAPNVFWVSIQKEQIRAIAHQTRRTPLRNLKGPEQHFELGDAARRVVQSIQEARAATEQPSPKKKSKKAAKGIGTTDTRHGKISAKLAALLQTPSKGTLKPGQSILDTPEGADRLRELVKLAKEQGYLTFDDLNKHVPESVSDPDEMELVMNRLRGMEIDIIDASQRGSYKVAPKGDEHQRSHSKEEERDGGGAEPMTPEFTERLKSGEMTLGDFLGSQWMKRHATRGANVADYEAFYMGATLAIAGRSQTPRSTSADRPTTLDGFDLLLGYLCVTPWSNERSEGVVLGIVWRQFAEQHPEEALEATTQRWRLFSQSTEAAHPGQPMARPLTNQVSISAGLGQLFIRSAELATSLGHKPYFSTRHLLLCLLGVPAHSIDPAIGAKMESLRGDVEMVRRGFRNWFARRREDDKPERIIDEWLGVSADRAVNAWVPAPLDDWLAKLHVRAEVLLREGRTNEMAGVREAIGRWEKLLIQLGREPIESEHVDPPAVDEESDARIGQRSNEPIPITTEADSLRPDRPISDNLRRGEYVEHFARLIASRDTRMPLSIGLFGDWGSGKSHFMEMLRRRIEKLSQDAREQPDRKLPYCKEIVAIRFNAWSYLDANLWASLVTEIFDKLFERLNPHQDELAAVQERLAQASGATAQAAEAVKIAEAETAKAKEELAAAEREQTVMKGAMSRLRELLTAEKKKRVDKLVQEVMGTLTEEGGHELEGKKIETVEELQETVERVKTEAEDIKNVWHSFQKQGAGWRWGWIAVSLLAVVGAFLIAPTLDGVQAWLSTLLKAGVGAVAPFVGTFLAFWKKVKGAVSKMQELQKDAEKARRESLGVQVAEQKVADARRRLSEAQAVEKQLQEQVLALAPGRRLGRFIEDRAKSSDYRGQLGLVSLARRDFEELSRLFMSTVGATAAEDTTARQKELETEADQIQEEAEREEIETTQAEVEAKRETAAALKMAETEKAAAAQDPNKAKEIEQATQSAAKRSADVAKRREEVRKKRELVREKRTLAAKLDLERKLKSAAQLLDRIVLFVDDLDRCQPQKVVEVLQAVHLLLAFDLFTVVVGVDQRCLKRSLRGELNGLLAKEEGAEARMNLMQTELDEERPATPLEYLEKIFQIPFHLPAMGQTGFQSLMENLTKTKEGTGDGAQKKEVGVPGGTGGSNVPPPGVSATTGPTPSVPPAASLQTAGPTVPDGTSTPGPVPAVVPGATEKPPLPPEPQNPAPSGEGDLGTAPEAQVNKGLQPWERKALKEYHDLIATPRATMRFLNTYRLVRAELSEEEWQGFAANVPEAKAEEDKLVAAAPARTVMLLLAVAAGFPSIAREWFDLLRKHEHASWDDRIKNCPKDGADWGRFQRAFGEFRKLGNGLLPHPMPRRPPSKPKPGERPEEPTLWADSIERYAF